MRVIALSLVVVPSVLAAQSQPLPLKYAPRPTSTEITAGDLMSRLYAFADDSMTGRETGTRGHVMSTDYIARELKRLGLEPAGDNGTYFQTVPMVNRPFDVARSSLSVDGATLVAGTDFVPQTFRGTPRPIDGASVVFGGASGDSAGLPADQLRGKIVLFAAGRPGGFGAASGALRDAAAIVRVANSRTLAQTLRGVTWPIANQTMRMAVAPAQTPLTIVVTEQAAEKLLGGPLVQATPGMAGKTVRGAIVFAESPAPARNVVAIVRGRDPKLRNTYVALGAHSDHVGISSGQALDHDSLRLHAAARAAILASVPAPLQGRPEVRARLDSIKVNLDSVRNLRPARLDSIRNGADDDGSGSMVLLELAEAFATSATKPKRSLLFVWHTGEEKGLLGSRWHGENATVPRDSIVAQLNMDMVGRGEASDFPGGGPTYLSLVGSRRLSSELGDTVEAVNRRQPRPLVIDYAWDAPGHPQNIYCRSDHFNYARWGIPVAFAWTALHNDYHQVTDEPQYISYDHMTRIAKLMHDVTASVANMSRRPVVDGQRLDPTGPCRQ